MQLVAASVNPATPARLRFLEQNNDAIVLANRAVENGMGMVAGVGEFRPVHDELPLKLWSLAGILQANF